MSGDYYDDDDDFMGQHDYDCDCESCEYNRAEDECGELPESMGGGCTMAGSEYCDFECPFRNRVLGGE
jgi:hypothetical protein